MHLKNAKYGFISILLIALSLLVSCDGGLEPTAKEDPTKPKNLIFGTIRYVQGKDSWPPADSMKDLRIVFFTSLPDSAGILSDLVAGKVLFTDSSLAFNVDSSSYQFKVTTTPITFKYIAVAQNYGTFLDWKVVGLYSNDGVTPKELFIGKDSVVRNIDINVDFKNLPPQPF